MLALGQNKTEFSDVIQLNFFSICCQLSYVFVSFHFMKLLIVANFSFLKNLFPIINCSNFVSILVCCLFYFI